MRKVRITDKRLADALAMRVLTDSDYEQWITDDAVKGFQVRITKTRKTLAYLQHWLAGKSKRLPLGEIGRAEDGKMSVVEARKKAAAARGVVDAGGDPAADRKRVKAESFEDAWNAYTASWSDEDRYRRECKALVANDVLPTLGSRPLATITKRDIAAVVEAVKKRSKARAWELDKNLRACFEWLVDSDLLDAVPMGRKGKPKAVDARECVLSEKETAAFWRATSRLEFPWQPIFRLLLLTATRRGEVGPMKWREVEGAVWSIPKPRVKNKQRNHVVDLPPSAVEIIASVPKLGEMLFSSTGTTPPSGYGKPMQKVRAWMRADIGEFERFTLHDLRRTIVTTLSDRFDYSDELGDRLLNHNKKKLTGTYNKATQRDKRKEALLKWSEYVIEISK